MVRGAPLRPIHARCLAATGQRARAEQAIAVARARLLGIAGAITDPSYRTSFLAQVPENRRTFELARQWLGGERHPTARAIADGRTARIAGKDGLPASALDARGPSRLNTGIARGFDTASVSGPDHLM